MSGVLQRIGAAIVRCGTGGDLIRGPCVPAGDCLDCESTPYQYDVSFTGVELALDCIECRDFDGTLTGTVRMKPGSFLGGPYRLTRISANPNDPGYCTWYGETTDATAQGWPMVAGCAGDPAGESEAAEITLRRVVGGFYLDVQTRGGNHTIAQLFVKFSPEASVKCASDLPAIINDFTWWTCFFGTATLGKNGFATLMPVGEEGI